MQEKETENSLESYLKLVQEYQDAKNTADLKRTAEDAIKLIQNEDDALINQMRGVFYNAIVYAVMQEGNYEEAAAKCARFIVDKRNTALCQCGLCRYAVRSARRYHNYELVERFCKRYTGFYKNTQNQESQEKMTAEHERLLQDAAGQQTYYEILLFWAEALLELKREAEFPEEQREELSRYVDGLLKDNGDFLHLPETVWKIHEMVGLEDKLLALDFSQWNAAVTRLSSGNSFVEVQEVQKKFSMIKTREDMRYDFLDMSYAKLMILLELLDEDYKGINFRFRTFQENVLKFFHRVYLDRVFEEEPDMLPAECRAALCMESFFARAERDWEGKLQDLKQCAKEDVSLGEQVKSFAKLLGEEQERCAREAEEASDQLRQMAAVVKQKVEVMLQGGLYAEALQTVKQLRTMLPDDEELKELEEKISGQL